MTYKSRAKKHKQVERGKKPTLPLLVNGLTIWSSSAADTTLRHLRGRVQPNASSDAFLELDAVAFLVLKAVSGRCAWPHALCAISYRVTFRNFVVRDKNVSFTELCTTPAGSERHQQGCISTVHVHRDSPVMDRKKTANMQNLKSHGVIANSKQTVCWHESPDTMPKECRKTRFPSAWLTVTTAAWRVTTAAGSSQFQISK